MDQSFITSSYDSFVYTWVAKDFTKKGSKFYRRGGAKVD